MKKFEWKLLLTGLVLVASASVCADSDHVYGVVEKFDLDHDGLITRVEYDQAFAQKMQQKFAWLDINQDGVISPEEFTGRHRDEFDKRWASWDRNGDGIISVDVVINQQQERRQADQ